MEPGPAARQEWVWAWGAVGLAALPALGAMYGPIGGVDPPQYAEIGRELFEGQRWLPLRDAYGPYLDKPPLFYWLVAASYSLFGVSDWAARLIPALAIHASVLLTYLLGRRSLGEAAAFRGAVVLALAPGLASVGRLLLLDGLLTLWMTLALFTASEAVRGEQLRWSWWLTAAAAWHGLWRASRT